MAVVTSTLVSFDGGAFQILLTFDDITGIVTAVNVINTSGRVVHSQASDGTRNWNVTIPPGNAVIPVPPNMNILLPTFTCYHRFPDV